ncbi:MAG: transcription antitermination factor NusB, partial [Nitrospira sp.]|nr:transcription antitermination factor NusB [Nitrospira sp.]
VVKNITSIDEMINRSAENWSFNRMALVDRNIMRIAAYEILFIKDIPVKVTINEAIEIAKRFGGEESCAFINGILDRILRDNKDKLNSKQ